MGDITKPGSLEAFFEGSEHYETYCIHAAGLISIQDKGDARLHMVNVEGTKNIIKLCQKHKIKRLLYISSVHAIPERRDISVQVEAKEFSPDAVHGEYAKTKAAATDLVLKASKNGLDAVCVHPSGIIGPGDDGRNHLVQVARLFLMGRLPLGVNGGYDMVDVRDVAKGALTALQKGSRGECYILSNRYVTIREYLFYLARASGKRNTIFLPIAFAKICAPVLLLCSKITGRRPLYTRYSLHAISETVLFSHDKATRELGYSPRDIKETVYDMFSYLNGRLPQKKKKARHMKEISAII